MLEEENGQLRDKVRLLEKRLVELSDGRSSSNMSDQKKSSRYVRLNSFIRL